MSEFYDDTAGILTRRCEGINTLLWRKIQDCYELCLGYSQYKEETEDMMRFIEDILKREKKLMELVDVLTKRISMLYERVSKLEAEKQ